MQLRGGNVRRAAAFRSPALVPNATPAAGATQVINVTNVKEVGGTCQARLLPEPPLVRGRAGSRHSGNLLGATAAVVSGVTPPWSLQRRAADPAAYSRRLVLDHLLGSQRQHLYGHHRHQQDWVDIANDNGNQFDDGPDHN